MTTQKAAPDRQTTTRLRQLIASAISCHKSYSVPGICTRYGLAEGTEEEAFRSKFKYTMARLESLPATEILRIARAVQDEEGHAEIGEALAKFDEQGGQQITPLTRQRIVAEIHTVPLSGNLDEIEFLKKLWPIDKLNPPGFSGESTMEDYIFRHRIRNFDMSNTDVLDALGIQECSQKQFFRLLEAMLDPLCRDIPEQGDLVTRLNRHLFHDGYCVDEVRRMSGAPVYAVRPLTKPGTTPADDEISKALLAFNPGEIHARWQEALTRRASDPRAAITSARTLLEDTCKWILHEANETFKDDDDLPPLYRRLAKMLKLAPDDHTEEVFRQNSRELSIDRSVIGRDQEQAWRRSQSGANARQALAASCRAGGQPCGHHGDVSDRNLGNEEARSAVLILESSIGVTYQARPFVPENPAQASGFLLVSAWY